MTDDLPPTWTPRFHFAIDSRVDLPIIIVDGAVVSGATLVPAAPISIFGGDPKVVTELWITLPADELARQIAASPSFEAGMRQAIALERDTAEVIGLAGPLSGGNVAIERDAGGRITAITTEPAS